MFKFVSGIVAPAMPVGCVGDSQGADYRSDWSGYDHDRPDPSDGNYYAERYNRNESRRYRARDVAQQGRVYRGQNGRFYYRLPDSTTGLIVANGIAPGGSELLGTILGAIGGGVGGRAVDRNREVRCS